MSQRFLRLPAVLAETGLSRATLFRRIADGSFPKGFKISKRAAAWSEAEVQSWKNARLLDRDVQEAA